MLRFGAEEAQPGQPLTNSERLGYELGDLQEVVQRLLDLKLISSLEIEEGQCAKQKQLAKYLQTKPETP